MTNKKQNQKKTNYCNTRNEKFKKLDELKNKLPELNNCDNIINHWSREFFTLWTDVRKKWNYGQHLEFRIKNSGRKKLYISSTFDIINNINELPFDNSTFIFISKAKSNSATVFNWSERHNKFSYTYLEKIDNDTFQIFNTTKSEIKKYSKPKQKGLLTDIQRFTDQSLIPLCLEKTRKLGNKKSNQNSTAQSNRKSHKIVNGIGVKLCFDTPDGYTEDIKNKLDGYRIAVSYGFTGVYKTFLRQIEKGDIHLEKDEYHFLDIILWLCQ